MSFVLCLRPMVFFVRQPSGEHLKLAREYGHNDGLKYWRQIGPIRIGTHHLDDFGLQSKLANGQNSCRYHAQNAQRCRYAIHGRIRFPNGILWLHFTGNWIFANRSVESIAWYVQVGHVNCAPAVWKGRTFSLPNLQVYLFPIEDIFFYQIDFVQSQKI